MISRLTAFAASFAILATASLAFAADLQHDTSAKAATASPMRIVQLERVVISAKRVTQAAR